MAADHAAESRAFDSLVQCYKIAGTYVPYGDDPPLDSTAVLAGTFDRAGVTRADFVKMAAEAGIPISSGDCVKIVVHGTARAHAGLKVLDTDWHDRV